MLAWRGTVRASARRGGGDVYCVDVSGGAQDEEERVGAVEEAERVAEGTDYSVSEGLRGRDGTAVRRLGVGRGGAGSDGFHDWVVG